ncbi:MAG: galactose mutarotase [Muribaculaceae bacterium]|nr:galactose mutarotase [Muribaculaceae bacterium]
MNISKESVMSPKGDITLYTLTNSSGAQVVLSSLGAGINKIIVPDKNGKMADVILGYENPCDYDNDGPCSGKTPGRYANRIKHGRITVEGKDYSLPINNGPNHLHGGPEGFQNKIWDSSIVGDSVVFTRVSPDGEMGYPGQLKATVTYTWDDNNQLTISYEAVTDAPTFVNLTNHAYFNLSGHDTGSVLNHLLRLNCSRYLPTDPSEAPLGNIDPVAGTPMDFTSPKAIGRDINEDFEALKIGKGYDHCYVVDGWEKGRLSEVATLTDPVSGRTLTISSTQPGAQVYTGNWLTGSPKGKGGVEYHDYDLVAIECQGFPDAPNQPAFPSQLLTPGETYRQTIIYSFGF